MNAWSSSAAQALFPLVDTQDANTMISRANIFTLNRGSHGKDTKTETQRMGQDIGQYKRRDVDAAQGENFVAKPLERCHLNLISS